MSIKPIKPFRAVVTGSAYPQDFTTDSEFEPGSEAAAAALSLKCLSDEDAELVQAAIASPTGSEVTEPTDEDGNGSPKTEGKSGAAKTKGAAPENKSAG